ncbi:hypothetical protein BH11ARM2_BH11ARM2_35300 [soil metagenome]
MSRFIVLTSIAVGFVLVGCGDNGMTQAEVTKKSPPMTDADRAKMAAGMAKGAEVARAEQSAWAGKNPADAARINAERAKMGRPPLGATR